MIKNKTTRITLLLASLTTLSLTGCAVLESGKDMVSGIGGYFMGGEDNISPPAELVEYEAEFEIDELWEESVGVGADEQFLNLELAISSGKIFVIDSEGLVEARDAETGDLIWELETEYHFSAGPGVGDKTAIVATSNAEVIAIDIETGKQKWAMTVSSEVLAIPVISKNIVIVRTTDGRVIALNEEEGTQLWTFERSVPALSIRGTGTPVIFEENMIAGFANGKLLALKLADGKSIWETSIAIPSGRSEVERLVDLDVDPVEAKGVIYISSFQGGTTAVIGVDGDVLWRNENVSSYSGINYDWRYLYITDAESHVWQLDQRNGASLWKQDELYNRRLTAPVAYDDYVVVGDYEGYVHWLSGSDGRQLARKKVASSPIDAKLVVIDDIVYIYAKDGTLTALKIKPFSD